MGDKEYKRVCFDISTDSLKRIDEIVELAKLNSRAELVRDAVRLYEYVLDKIDNGCTVIDLSGKIIERGDQNGERRGKDKQVQQGDLPGLQPEA